MGAQHNESYAARSMVKMGVTWSRWTTSLWRVPVHSDHHYGPHRVQPPCLSVTQLCRDVPLLHVRENALAIKRTVSGGE